MLQYKKYHLFYGLVILLVVVADQVSKWYALASLTNVFDAQTNHLQQFLWQQHPMRTKDVAVFDNFWHFRYVENPGAAWGLFANAPDYVRTPFFLIVSLVAFGFIIYSLQRSHSTQYTMRSGFCMVLGGAIGNFLDRVRLGYVIDFIDWHWYKHSWPTFNVADAAISIGVVLLLIDMFLQQPSNKAT